MLSCFLLSFTVSFAEKNLTSGMLLKMSATWYFILIVTYVTVNGQSEKETLENFKWPRWGLFS